MGCAVGSFANDPHPSSTAKATVPGSENGSTTTTTTMTANSTSGKPPPSTITNPSGGLRNSTIVTATNETGKDCHRRSDLLYPADYDAPINIVTPAPQHTKSAGDGKASRDGSVGIGVVRVLVPHDTVGTQHASCDGNAHSEHPSATERHSGDRSPLETGSVPHPPPCPAPYASSHDHTASSLPKSMTSFETKGHSKSSGVNGHTTSTFLAAGATDDGALTSLGSNAPFSGSTSLQRGSAPVGVLPTEQKRFAGAAAASSSSVPHASTVVEGKNTGKKKEQQNSSTKEAGVSTAGDADSYSRESQLSDIVLSSCPTSPTLSTSSLCCTHPTRRHTGEGGLPWLTALHTIGDNLEEQRQHAGAVNLEDEYFVYDDAVISKNEARAKHWRLAGRKPAPMSIAVSNTSINTAAAAAAAAAATDYGTRRRSGTEASREELTKGTTSHSAGRFGLPSSMSLGDQVAERFPLRSASFSSPSGLAGVPMSVLKRQSTESSVSAFSFSDFEVCVDEMDIQLGVPGVTAHGENNIDGTRDGMSLAPSSSTAASSFALFYPNAGAPLSVLPPGPPSSWSPSGGVGGGGCINNGASGGAPATTTLLMVASANAFSGSGPPSLSESAAFPSSFSSSPSANESVPSAPSTGVPGAPAGSSAAAVLFLRNAVATATAAPRNDLTTLTDTTRLSERASLFGAAGLTANAMVPVVLTSGRPATHMEFNTGPEGDMEDLAGADARLSGDQQTRNNALSREDDPNTNSNTMYSLALSPTPASLAAAFSALSTRGAIRVNLNTTVTSTVSLAPNTVCALMQRQRSMAAKAHRPLRRLDLSTHLGHSARVKCIALSPAEREYVSCSNEDASVTLNSARNGTEIGIFTGHTDTVISAAYSPDGRYLATTSKDKTMILWDAMTAKQLHRLLHSKVVICSSFAPDSKYVVSGCQDRVCRIWDTRRGKEWLSFNKHEGIIIAVAFSPDGNQVCSASSDRTLRVWSASTAKARLTLTGHTGFILSCSYSSDGMRIISNDEEHVRVWSTVDGSCVLVVSPHDVVNRFVHPKDGVRTTLAAAAKSSSDTNTSAGGASGSTSNRLGWTLSRAAPGAFTDYMLVACNNRFVYLLDCKTGEEVTSVFCKAPVYCLAAGAGQLAACGDSFGNVYMLQFE